MSSRSEPFCHAHHLLVDIDDGYCDVEVARYHVVSMLESISERLGGPGGPKATAEMRALRWQTNYRIRRLRDQVEARSQDAQEVVVIARTDATGLKEISPEIQALRKPARMRCWWMACAI